MAKKDDGALSDEELELSLQLPSLRRRKKDRKGSAQAEAGDPAGGSSGAPAPEVPTAEPEPAAPAAEPEPAPASARGDAEPPTAALPVVAAEDPPAEQPDEQPDEQPVEEVAPTPAATQVDVPVPAPRPTFGGALRRRRKLPGNTLDAPASASTPAPDPEPPVVAPTPPTGPAPSAPVPTGTLSERLAARRRLREGGGTPVAATAPVAPPEPVQPAEPAEPAADTEATPSASTPVAPELPPVALEPEPEPEPEPDPEPEAEPTEAEPTEAEVATEPAAPEHAEAPRPLAEAVAEAVAKRFPEQSEPSVRSEPSATPADRTGDEPEEPEAPVLYPATPAGVRDPDLAEHEAEHEDEPRDRRRPLAGLVARVRALELPDLPETAAVVATGVITGVVGVVLCSIALQLCSVVQGTGSCGSPVLLTVVGTLVVATILGARLLRRWSVAEAGSTSFLAVGLVTFVALVPLIDIIFSWVMFLLVPTLSAGMFVLAHFLTGKLAEGVEGAEVDKR